MSSFADSVEEKVENGKVDIPAKYGKEFVFGFLYGSYIRLIARNYQLKEDVIIHKGVYSPNANMITISFHHIMKTSKGDVFSDTGNRGQLPSVVVTTQGLDPEIHIPRNTFFNTIKLSFDAVYVRQLLREKVENSILKNIIENKHLLIFENFVSEKLEQIALDMTRDIVKKPLHDLFYKVKSEEIFCYLHMDLMERQDRKISAINVEDMKAVYRVRVRLLENISTSPSLTTLAGYANMSLSKLKRLFKQVYGKNIYEYHQDIRLKETAYLLKHKQLSVSEVGYSLGFSNLSHFSRVFNAKFEMNPKRYSMQ